MSTPTIDRVLPAALRGVPLSTLLGWAREPAIASPEIREALRDPAVLAMLHELALRDAPCASPSCMASPITCAAEPASK